jgi:hypothetical protein
MSKIKPPKRPPIQVAVPDWDTTVNVRHLTAGELAGLYARMRTLDKADAWMADMDLVALCVVDDQGKPIFTSSEVADLDPPSVGLLLSEAMSLNGLSGQSAKKKR